MGIIIGPLHVRRATWLPAPRTCVAGVRTLERMEAWYGTGHTLTRYEPYVGGIVETDAGPAHGDERRTTSEAACSLTRRDEGPRAERLTSQAHSQGPAAVAHRARPRWRHRPNGLNRREPFKQCPQGDTRFEPREVRAQAVVQAPAKTEMRVRLAL